LSLITNIQDVLVLPDSLKEVPEHIKFRFRKKICQIRENLNYALIVISNYNENHNIIPIANLISNVIKIVATFQIIDLNVDQKTIEQLCLDLYQLERQSRRVNIKRDQVIGKCRDPKFGEFVYNSLDKLILEK